MEDCLQDLAHAPQWIGDKILVSQIKFLFIGSLIRYHVLYVRNRNLGLLFRSQWRCVATCKKFIQICLRISNKTVCRMNKMTLLFLFCATFRLLLTLDILLLYLYSVKLLVDEIEFNSYVPDAGNININASASPRTQMQRLQCLHRCLGSVYAWCSTFFSMPSDSYFELPFAVVFYQLSRILKMLLNLTFLCEPGRDCNEVRAKVDLFDAIDKCRSGLDRVQNLLDGDDGVEGLSVKKVHVSRALRLNKSTVQAEFLSRQRRASGCAGADEGQYSLPEIFYGNVGNPLNIFLDDQWTSEAWENIEVGEGWVIASG